MVLRLQVNDYDDGDDDADLLIIFGPIIIEELVMRNLDLQIT